MRVLHEKGLTKYSTNAQCLALFVLLNFSAKERESNALNIKYVISHYLFFQKTLQHIRLICGNFCLQLLLMRIIFSIKLVDE